MRKPLVRTIAKLLAATLLLILLGAQAAWPAEPPLNAPVASLITAAKLKNASVSVSVIDLATGQVLCAIDDQRPMTPASNLKLITTGAAFLILGDHYNFTTTLYTSGDIDKTGALQGDLVVIASGDPAISGREHAGKTTAIFDAWAAEIAKSIRTVRGNLVIDDTLFDRQYLHPAWPQDQLATWYCAPVSTFALNDNCVDVTVRPGAAPGQPTVVLLDPPTSFFQMRNTCTTVASGRAKAYISRAPDSDLLLISGKLTPKSRPATASVALTNPEGYAAVVLWERLAAAGVRIEGKVVFADTPIDTGDMEPLVSTSHSLVSAINTANKRSQNFYAEMIFKTLGSRLHTPASFADGVKAVTAALAKAGIQPGSCVIDDGSGLSNRNAVSALQFTTFLRYMAATRYAETYIASLPVAGAEGSLRSRMNQPPCARNIFAKTGHIQNVSALSGYARTTAGKLLAFSILTNGTGGVGKLEDDICRLLMDVKP